MIELLRDVFKSPLIKEMDSVFVHCSVDGLGIPFNEVPQFIEQLIAAMGPEKTLVTPSLPFGKHGEYDRYVASPMKYDVMRTPARVNLFGEMLRRFPGVLRSLNPLYPCAAIGPLAEHIISESHLDEYPFDERTVFGKLGKLRTVILGLGVSPRTNGFIHLVDHKFRNRYEIAMYSQTPLAGRVYSSGKEIFSGTYYYVKRQMRKSIRPDLLVPFLVNKPFFETGNGELEYFILELEPFLEMCGQMALDAVNKNEMPIWLKNCKG